METTTEAERQIAVANGILRRLYEPGDTYLLLKEAAVVTVALRDLVCRLQCSGARSRIIAMPESPEILG
jgi:hypothetical protein